MCVQSAARTLPARVVEALFCCMAATRMIYTHECCNAVVVLRDNLI
eukprot:COSAG02_NODE_1647_length_11517_cov_2.751533_20_plen_46_part_00